ncbi:hypothetical protein DSL72_006246 [Monilinia vaccinii-corymbosi]|uniref:Uncharacterized protein n=1 Tax=Monilinia vaccinii-corymbosi TaxID=61207 RepID=A0A8A3PMK7_9HELO|nr:hypothetical protein DSL72_006246 [Monilinia vaccinii-corymbosi]
MLLALCQFRSSDYFWMAATCVLVAITLLIAHFNKDDDKEVEENYATAWEIKTRDVQQKIQDRREARDRNINDYDDDNDDDDDASLGATPDAILDSRAGEGEEGDYEGVGFS